MSIIYFVLSALELAAEAAVEQLPLLHYFTKPLPMICLMIWCVQACGVLEGKRLGRLMFAALFFAFGGDVLLLFAEGNELFFMLGLASFLLTHLLYILIFKPTIADLRRNALWLVPLLLYFTVFGAILFPRLPSDLLLPVVVYSCTILGMGAAAISLRGRVNDSVFKTILGGAIAFVFSDSLIAINKFITPLPLSALAIMSLYLMGQYFIFKGFLELVDKNFLKSS